MATEDITVVGHRKPAQSDQLTSGSQVRAPRIGLTINGTQANGGLVSFSVESTNFFTADTWSAEIALSGLPVAFNAAFWESTASIEVQLQASVTAGGALALVVGGFVDEHEIDWEEQTLSIKGRDYTAALVDNLSNDKLTNQTSSQVVTLFAQRRGLTPQVTATTAPIGRYLNGQNDYMAEDTSEWRVLSFLAQQEGFDLYAKGKTLVFAPAAPDPNPLAVKYIAPGQGRLVGGNVASLKTRHKKVLAGNVTVQVRSWDYQAKQPIISTFKSQKTQADPKASGGPSAPTAKLSRAAQQGGAGANGPVYILRRAGLTQAQADDLAQKTLKDFTSHEREVDFTGPGIIGIDPRRTLRLTGTGTAADMDYPIKAISRKFDWDGGFSMTVNAKSGSPDEAIRL
jgi:hypothetical protein